MAEPRTPRWVWAVCMVLGLSQPVVVLATQLFPPTGTVPTGLHIPDSAIFLQCMEAIEQGFYSPYAMAWGGDGADIRYYGLPFHWVYAGIGWATGLVGIAPIAALAWANGLCAGFYLWAVYRFFAQAAPQVCRTAFLIFALGGGPGGLLYLAAVAAGADHMPGFEAYSMRWVVYELFEGAHLLPATYFPRLYYTLPLGLGFLALGRLARNMARLDSRLMIPEAAAFLLAALINPRLGAFLIGVLGLLWATRGGRRRAGLGTACLFVGAAAGCVLGFLWMQVGTATVETHRQITGMAAWPSPLLIACLFVLPALAWEIPLGLRRSPRWVSLLGWTVIAYLGVYALLAAFRQAYYGLLAVGREGTVAISVSDRALIAAGAVGVLLALGRMLLRNPREPEEDAEDAGAPEDGFFPLGALGLGALSLSAFGGGLFLLFGPQRLVVLLWPFLAVLAAKFVQRLWAWRPMAGVFYLAPVLLGGVASIAVGLAFFQAPLGRVDAKGPYRENHAEIMTAGDAVLVDALGAGRVLAPVLMADVVVRRKGNPVLGGMGASDLAGRSYGLVSAISARLLSPAADPAKRLRGMICEDIRYVLCPETWPVDPLTVELLYEAEYLEPVVATPGGVLFRLRELSGEELLTVLGQTKPQDAKAP